MQNFYESRLVNGTLWDAGFELLPLVNSSQPANVFAGGSAIICLLRLCIFTGPITLRYVVFRRTIFIWGLIFAARGICIIITPLPNPYYECIPQISFPGNIWMEALAIFPWCGPIFGSQLTCQDVMFSGHTVMGTLYTVTLLRYIRLAPWGRSTHQEWVGVVVRLLGGLWLCGGWFFIIAAHFHYTVDVFVGIMITILVFLGYNMASQTCWTVGSFSLLLAPWAPFVKWFERHSKDLELWRNEAQCSLERARAIMELEFS
jgi:hypothetical protein